jgi:hypothetical protein
VYFQVRHDLVNIFTDFYASVGPNELFPNLLHCGIPAFFLWT